MQRPRPGRRRGRTTRAARRSEHVPHIGWNEVTARPARRSSPASRRTPTSTSCTAITCSLADTGNEAGRTAYCGGFTAAIEVPGRAIFGTQFHPEKSQRNGFRLLRNFLAA
jgi:imidazole glycerol-phosphate synthase subunit HisH